MYKRKDKFVFVFENKMTTSQKKSIISIDTIKLFAQGALGAMTFGMYHQYTTNRIIEMNNRIQEMEYERKLEKMNADNERKLEKMNADNERNMEKMNADNERNMEKINNLEKLITKKSRWWF